MHREMMNKRYGPNNPRAPKSISEERKLTTTEKMRIQKYGLKLQLAGNPHARHLSNIEKTMNMNLKV